MRTIKAFEIIRHGVEFSDYFPGCGVAHTDFTDVATGIGDSEREAMEDAAESLTQAGYDVAGCKDLEDEISKARTVDDVENYMAEQSDDFFTCDCDEQSDDFFACDCDADGDKPWVHVSIRVKADNDETADQFAEHYWPDVAT